MPDAPRRLASRSFFSNSRTRINETPAILLRYIAMDSPLNIATGWLNNYFGNIHRPSLTPGRRALKDSVTSGKLSVPVPPTARTPANLPLRPRTTSATWPINPAVAGVQSRQVAGTERRRTERHPPSDNTHLMRNRLLFACHPFSFFRELRYYVQFVLKSDLECRPVQSRPQ